MSTNNKNGVPWHSSFAAFLANAVSLSLHPLENVKVRFQASDLASNNPIPKYLGISDAIVKMYRHEGVASLYRGVLLNLFASSVAQSLFFWAYADGKRRYNFDQQQPGSWVTAWISLRAGILSMTLTTPMWVVKTRITLFRQTTNQSGRFILPTVCKDMMVNEGPQAFFRGYVPSLFLASYGMIQMYSYENINFLMGFQSGQKLSWDNFMIPFMTGGFSKCVASATLMPINVVRLRLQMKKYSAEQVKELGLAVQTNTKQSVTYDGIFDCAQKIMRNEGIKGFYKGITPNMLRIFPSSGLFFLVYEGVLLKLKQTDN